MPVYPDNPTKNNTNGDVDFSVSTPRKLHVAKALNKGQREMIAWLRTRCRTYGYCLKNKAVKDYAAYSTEPGSTAHKTEETVKRYMRHAEKIGYLITIKNEQDKVCLIAHEDVKRMKNDFDNIRTRLQEKQKEADKIRQERTVLLNQVQDEHDALRLYVLNTQDCAGDVETFACKPENPPENSGEFSESHGKILQEFEGKSGRESYPESPAENAGETTTESLQCDGTAAGSFDPCLPRPSVVVSDSGEGNEQNVLNKEVDVRAQRDELVAQMVEFGVTLGVAIGLADKKPSSCREQIDHLKFGKVKSPDDPAAYLVTAIRKDYAPTQAYLNAQADKQKLAARQENREKQREACNEAQKDKEQSIVQENLLLDAYVRRLSDQELKTVSQTARIRAKPDPIKGVSPRINPVMFQAALRFVLWRSIEELPPADRNRLESEITLPGVRPLYQDVPVNPSELKTPASEEYFSPRDFQDEDVPDFPEAQEHNGDEVYE